MARMSKLRLADKKNDWRLEDVSEEELNVLAGADQKRSEERMAKIDTRKKAKSKKALLAK